jgi:hypothetical protein
MNELPKSNVYSAIVCLFLYFALALLISHVQHVLFLVIFAQTLLCKSVNIITLFLSRINQEVGQVVQDVHASCMDIPHCINQESWK